MAGKKIYTRTGDSGTTALFGGDRVPKTNPRIAAYGTVDEANSHLGLARAHLSSVEHDDAHDDAHAGALDATLGRLQEELFVLGADLATPLGARPVVPRITEEQVAHLERDIDAFEAHLPPLTHFILPGGAPAGAALHVARTVCRRAERLTVAAHTEEAVNEQAAVYLNRLSDLLFVLARAANRQAHVREDTWAPDEPQDRSP